MLTWWENNIIWYFFCSFSRETPSITVVEAIGNQGGKKAAPASITKVMEGGRGSHYFLFCFWDLIQVEEVTLGTS